MKPFIFFLLFSPISIFCQITPDVLLKTADKEFPEIIQLQNDRCSYLPGDTIFFNVYCTRIDNHQALSSILKVQIIDSASIILAEENFPVINGFCKGYIRIPEDILQKICFIKAFTDVSAKKYIGSYYLSPIILSRDVLSRESRQLKAYCSWDESPLIANTVNDISIVVADEWGKQIVNAQFCILNKKGDTIAKGQTNELGIGSFSLYPNGGDEYKAFISYNTKKIEVSLPITGKGIRIQGEYKNGNYFLTINNYTENAFLHVLGIIGDNQIFEKKINASINVPYQFKIPVAALEEGVMRILVTDSIGNYQNEKFLYINNHNVFGKSVLKNAVSTLKATSDSVLITNQFITDSLINVSVELVGIEKSKNLVNANAVYFKSTAFAFFKTEDSINTMNRLLATLPLTIPRWLMLVKSYKDSLLVASDSLPAYIKGKLEIVDNKNRRVFPTKENFTFSFVEQNGVARVLDYEVQADSTLLISGLLFENATIYFNSKNKKTYTLKLLDSGLNFTCSHSDDENFMQSFVELSKANTLDYAGQAFRTDTIQKQANNPIENSAFTKQLDNVTVYSDITLRLKTKQLEKRYVTGIFANGQNTKTLNLLDDPSGSSYNDTYQYLLDNYQNLMSNHRFMSLNNFSGNNGIAIFLNEQLITKQILRTIPLREVALVKFYPNGFILVPGNGAAVAVYTIKPQDFIERNSKTADGLRMAGFSKNWDAINVSTALHNFEYCDLNYTMQENKQLLLKITKAFLSGSKKYKLVVTAVNSSFEILTHEENVELK